MMKFLYDSLDTIKGLKHPTKKQYISLTVAIFVLVILVWLYFVLADALFTSGYEVFYAAAGN